MRKLHVLLLTSMFLATSCIVSKKKYDELQLTSDTKINGLNAQIEKLIEEYNLMRNDLASNNAKKDMLIDEVSKKVYGLSSDQEEIKDELEMIKDRYKWARHENKQNEETISKLNDKISRLQQALENNKLSLDNTMTKNTEYTNSLKKRIRLLEKNNKIYASQVKRLKDKLLELIPENPAPKATDTVAKKKSTN